MWAARGNPPPLFLQATFYPISGHPTSQLPDVCKSSRSPALDQPPEIAQFSTALPHSPGLLPPAVVRGASGVQFAAERSTLTPKGLGRRVQAKQAKQSKQWKEKLAVRWRMPCPHRSYISKAHGLFAQNKHTTWCLLKNGLGELLTLH